MKLPLAPACVLALVFTAADIASAFVVPPGPPFNVKRIVVELRDAAYRHSAPLDLDAEPRIFASGSNGQHRPRSVSHDYISIVREEPFAGIEGIYGYLGRGYRAGSEIKAESYERTGNEIRITFRYVEERRKLKDGPDAGSACFFFAPLPRELPDGKYHVAVTLRDFPETATAGRAIETTFAKPDAISQRRAADLAEFDKLTLTEQLERYRAAAAAAPADAAPIEGDAGHDHEKRENKMREGKYAQLARLELYKPRLIAHGRKLTPLLLDALKEECERSTEAVGRPVPRGICRELMQMLLAIGDPQAAPLLMGIVSGRCRCHPFVRFAGLESLERLTFMRFRRFDDEWQGHDSVAAAEAVVIDRSLWHPSSAEAYDGLAPKYQRWLAEHPVVGMDRTPWLKTAAKQGRAWLATSDLKEAYVAAIFLRSGKSGAEHDDDPDATSALIAEILSNCKFERQRNKNVPDDAFPNYRHLPTDRLLKPIIWSWVGLLMKAGPIEERHTAMLIKLDRSSPRWYEGVVKTFDVGGREAMQYRLELYRRLMAEITAAGIDPDREFKSDQLSEVMKFVSHRERLRFEIERWAGRMFATEQDIVQWFEANRDRSQRQWIEDGLPILAAQADAADPRAQTLLREILGDDLPHKPEWPSWTTWGRNMDWPNKPEAAPPFRVKWLADNRANLRYLPHQGRFRLEVRH